MEPGESLIREAMTVVTSEMPAPSDRSTAPTRITVAWARLTRTRGVKVMKFILKTW